MILDEAARLATVEGIGGLSIARLAAAVGMSKSGLFTLFGSKEELQLATVETAIAVFDRKVLGPGAEVQAGLPRLRAYVQAYLVDYVEADTFPGGCFMAAVLTEVAMQPGPVRDRLVRFFDGWMAQLEDEVRAAQAAGDLNASEDPAQIAFEVEAALFLGNAQYVSTRSDVALARARATVERRLRSSGPGPG